MAPKLCPVSWATTCHSVRPAVETAAPDTVALPLCDAVVWQRTPSHAMPTSLPVGQFERRCHRPAPSSPSVARHFEKTERRSSSVSALLQGTFHGLAGSTVLGHVGSWTSSLMMPSETLKVDL
jgi:hypothetical protein